MSPHCVEYAQLVVDLRARKVMAEERDAEGGRKKRESTGDSAPVENGYEEEPNFSDDEDFIDDITDEGEQNVNPQWRHSR